MIELNLRPHAADLKLSSQEQKLKAAAREFEAVMLGQLMKQMRSGSKGLLEGGSAMRTFREMMDDQLAKEMAHSGGIGLAEVLHRQLAAAQAGLR